MTDQFKPTSLRDVAKHLGCSHSSLSEQIHRGDLTQGVAIRDGRIVVTDPEALMASWNGIPVRKTLEMIELRDVALDRNVTAAQLFEERDSLSLLATALVREALANGSVKTLKTRISARLREVAELHGADKAGIARAWKDLGNAIILANAADEDES